MDKWEIVKTFITPSVGLIGWFWGIYQFVTARRVRVKTEIDSFNQEHMRVLAVKVTNKGTELNEVGVLLRSTGTAKDGTKDALIPLIAIGEYPSAFKFAYTKSFTTTVDDPSLASPLLQISPRKITIEIYSGTRVIKKIRATRWRKHLEFMRNPQPHLPKPPEGVFCTTGGKQNDWRRGVPERWI